MSYARLEELGGLQWPCYDETHPGRAVPPLAALGGPGARQPRAVRAGRARPAGRPARRRLPDPADDRPPARLVQHRRPDRRLHARRCGAARRSTSRPRTPSASGWPTASASGSSRAAARSRCRSGSTRRCGPGLTFMTLHFQDDVATNLLTIDATDPKSGTAEFKATAIRIEKLATPAEAAQATDGRAARATLVAMDLHVAPRATPAERAAVDAVLGPPIGPPWSGGGRARSGGRRSRRPSAATRRGRVATCSCPALHAVQSRFGWISRPRPRLHLPAADRAAGRGLRRRHVLRSARHDPAPAGRRPRLRRHRLPARRGRGPLRRRSSGRSGRPAHRRSTGLRPGCAARAWASASARRRPCSRSPAPRPGRSRRHRSTPPASCAASRTRRPTAPDGAARPRRRARPGDPAVARSPRRDPRLRPAGRATRAPPPRPDRPGRPESLDAYRATGGYRALARAIELGPTRVIAEVTASRLVGRGGAAFPTGRKWAAVAAQPARPHYLVCNADESEPGTFKDRVLMEEDPFALVEAMTIAGFATGRRARLPLPPRRVSAREARLANAIARRARAGLLGTDILGSGFAFDIELRRGAGAYICGEETALFNSIEGKRGEPRNKPPFPVEVGLFGKPTIVNNVETLVNIPAIVLDGGAAFAAIGTPGSTGPKLFCLSGHVARPGVYEVRSARPCASSSSSPAASPAAGRSRRSCSAAPPGVFVGPGRARHAADLRGDPGDRRDARLGRGDGLRRDGRPRRHPAPDRGVLPRRVVRPVRPLPRRHGPPGGAPRAARGRTADRLARRGAGPPRARSARRCATPRSAGSARPPSSAIESALPPAGDDRACERRPDPVQPAAAPEPSAGAAARAGRRDGRADDRRPRRQRAGGLDDPRRLPRRGHRHADALLPREPHARSTSAGSASSRSPARARSSRPARAGSSRGWRC